MHQALVAEIVKVCRQRSSEGDHPTVKALSVETLEGALIELAAQLDAKYGKQPPDGISKSAPRIGFHWRNGWYFQRLPDGAVFIRRHYNNGSSELFDSEMTIPVADWASIIASVSEAGDNTQSYEAASAFHGEARQPGGIPSNDPGAKPR